MRGTKSGSLLIVEADRIEVVNYEKLAAAAIPAKQYKCTERLNICLNIETRRMVVNY